MLVRIIEKKDNSMRFVVEGINPPLANALRRLMLAEVPSMAIEDVVIIENSSVLHDENLALRLGLIPLKTDIAAYNFPEECSCKSELGCNLCRAVLALDVQAKDEITTVYSGDLVPENPNIAPVSNKIPIVKLVSGQKIRLEAYARLGRGKDHAKWQPVAACTYRYMPVVKINSAKCNACGNCVDVCPKKVFVKERDTVKVSKEIECILCEDCVKVCDRDPPAVQINWNENTLIFYIESTGALSVEQIMSEALKIYEKKYTEFMNQITGIGNEPKETS
ncbi:MAG: DNA-directed RNA polymerase subunit D [Candidatus Bathyarchaeia archaeon]